MMDLVFATLIGFVSGALVPLFGLWLQSRWKRREITLRHEEVLFQKRLEIATKAVTACYNYFTNSHRYALAREEEERALFRQRRAQLGLRMTEIEPEIDLFFPFETVKLFRDFLNSVDDNVRSNVPRTSVGYNLDTAFTTFVNKLRADIGIEAAESKLTQSLPRIISRD